MLDLLLSAEKDGLIDDEGIKEEVNTFLFGVSLTKPLIIKCIYLKNYINNK